MFLSTVLLALAALATGFPLQDDASVEDSISLHDGRIVGGKDTTIEKYPHQISLERMKKHYCGGSLISTSIVVTATHCVYDEDPTRYAVRAGSTERGKGGVLVPVAKLAYNQNFSFTLLDGDIGMVKLQTPVTFSDKIKPITLIAVGKDPAENESLTVTGWGRTQEGSNVLPTVLQEVSVPHVTRKVCQRSFSVGITENMICAGISGEDSCHGDTGGPLINSKRELVGIVSWGKGCGRPRHPGVYGSVNSPFIHKFITDFVNSNP